MQGDPGEGSERCPKHPLSLPTRGGASTRSLSSREQSVCLPLMELLEQNAPNWEECSEVSTSCHIRDPVSKREFWGTYSNYGSSPNPSKSVRSVFK